MRIGILTYGCAMNRAESEIMAAILGEDHDIFFEKEEGVDVIIVNTCGVKLTTEQRVLAKIKKISQRGIPLVVSGCLPHINLSAVRKAAPEAVILGVNGPIDIRWAVEYAVRGISVIKIYTPETVSKLTYNRLRINPFILIVPIAEGCTGNCAYCGTKLARGRIRSLPPEKIVSIIKKGIREGVHEIWLTSQDNGAYGKDIGVTLGDLLSRISEIEGDFRVRIGMMNPGDARRFLDAMIDVVRNDSRFYRFFHLPVQSGSDKILRKMRRMHDVRSFEECASQLRKKLNATIATDIIVGFPDETDDDFKMSMDLLRRTRPDIVNISRYGPRKGTEAARMKQLPSQVVKKRTVEMYQLVREIMLSRNREWVRWKGIVRIIEKKKTPVGRTPTYKPVAINEHLPMGTWIEVEVVDCTEAALIGKVIRVLEK